MKQLVLDAELRSRIGDLHEQVQVSDESGHVVGVLVPAEVYRRLVIQKANSQITDEELERRFSESGGRTLKEIKKRLGA